MLHKYFEGRTTTEEEKGILDWIGLSSDNYKAYLKERKLFDALLVHIERKEVPAYSAQGGGGEKWWKMAAIAASIAFIITLAAALIPSSGKHHNMHSIIVPPGQRTQLVLEDGTKVWLNARTTLTYPAQFDADSRKVTLNGEGYFEVKPNKYRPFIIVTEKYKVNVLGTTINVRAYEKGSNPFELSLLTGIVNIENEKGEIRDMNLRPNEYALEQYGKLEKGTIKSYDRFRWKDGLIVLDDEPFDKLMMKFSEYYDIKIILQNTAYNKYRCTGKFRMSDGVDYALRVLQRDVRFNYKRDEDVHVITIF